VDRRDESHEENTSVFILVLKLGQYPFEY